MPQPRGLAHGHSTFTMPMTQQVRRCILAMAASETLRMSAKSSQLWQAMGFTVTAAGNGAYGYSGDGGPATSGRLNSPHGLAVDARGNLFIADSQNHRIRKVT